MSNQAKYTGNMRNYMMYGVVSSLSNQLPAAWEKNRIYKVSDKVLSNGRIYIATTDGSTGESAPKHSTGIITSSKVAWLYVSDAPNSNDINSNLYVTLGGATAWEDDNNPPEVKIDDSSLTNIKNDLLTLIKLDSSNIRIGLARVSWIQNEIYSSYDPAKNIDEIYDPTNPSPSAYQSSFYVITSTNDIYKCIDNNNRSKSTHEPTGKSIQPSTYADGYIWKYMGSIKSTDVAQFTTEDLVPIEVKSFDDGSDQWKVQQAARSGSISKFGAVSQRSILPDKFKYDVIGTGHDCIPIFERDAAKNITRISVYDGGSGYSEGTYVIAYAEDAEGSGAKLNSVLKDGKLTDVKILNGGSGYATEPQVFLIGDGVGAEIELVINSVDGSISNVNIIEAGENYTKLDLIVVPGTAVVYAPAVLAASNGHGHNIVNELGARALILGMKNEPSMAPYLVSGLDNQIRQISLISNVKTKDGESPSLLVGAKHPNQKLTQFDTATGFILWTSNNKPIVRTQTQEEYIKIGLII